MATDSGAPDLYRHTPIRYLGYANEVGEAFRSIIGRRWVNVSYGVATLYVLADTVDKSIKSYIQHQGSEGCAKRTAYITADTLIWQMLASVIIPGFTINRVCALSNYWLRQSDRLPKSNRKWVVTGIGLAVIPFIIKPIDVMVDEALDRSLRNFAP